MKRSMLTLAALLMLSTGAVTTAKAVEFGVGPGGVYVGEHRDRYYDRDYDRSYNRYGGGCRTVITRGTNRYGESVTTRRRVCD